MAEANGQAQASGEPEPRIFAATMRLASVQGWSDTRLSDIAEEASVPLDELRRRFPTKSALLAGFSRHIDLQVLSGTDPDIAMEPVRDRLLDVVMRRLDALQPYKPGLPAVARDLACEPARLGCFMAGPFRRTIDWMLEAARIEPWGPLQPLQVKGFGLIYLSTLRVWLRDDSEDQARTMAALDKALDRADAVIGSFTFRRRRRRDGLDGVDGEVSPAD